MNRMLVVVFDSENKASEGTRAMRQLHEDGDITLYSLGVIARNLDGTVSVKQASDQGPVGTGIGLAVGALIGLLAGPAGMVIGAIAGSFAGAVRDYWVAGVGLDFVEEAGKVLLPGKAAVISEIEEDWVIPLDSRMEALGGVVIRRARSDIAQAQFDRDISSLHAEIADLETECKDATGGAKIKLQAKVATAKLELDAALKLAQHKVGELELEAEAKIKSVEAQVAKARGDIKARLQARVKHVRGSYNARSVKLKQAWGLAKEALAA